METLQQWGIGLAVTMAVASFIRFCPKKKINTWVEKPLRNFGRLVSKFLILRLGKKAAEKVEEGIIVTLLDVIGNIALYIKEGLLEDNEKKKGTKNGNKKTKPARKDK